MDKLVEGFIQFGKGLDVLHNQYEQYRRADPDNLYYQGACNAMINTKILVVNLLEELGENDENPGLQFQEPHRIL